MIAIFLLLSMNLYVQGLQRPLVIGHRGTAYLPELTLSSQSMAHAYGADIIEIDVCLSRDDQLIVIHDIHLNGVTNVNEIYPNRNREDGLHYVIDFDLGELRRLKVHERTQPKNGNQVYPLRFPSKSNVNFQLSTLNETLDLLLGLNRATGRQRQLLIEIKKPEYHSKYNKSISARVLATLNSYNLIGFDDPIILQSFYIEELMHIRLNLKSKLRLFALMTLNEVGESSSDYNFYRSEEGIQNLSKIVQGLTPDHRFVVDYDTNGTILRATNFTKWAHQYNLSVYPFTFRQDQFPGTDFRKFIEYYWHTVEVDGFITDHADTVLDILQRDNNASFLRFYLSLLVTSFTLTYVRIIYYL